MISSRAEKFKRGMHSEESFTCTGPKKAGASPGYMAVKNHSLSQKIKPEKNFRWLIKGGDINNNDLIENICEFMSSSHFRFLLHNVHDSNIRASIDRDDDSAKDFLSSDYAPKYRLIVGSDGSPKICSKYLENTQSLYEFHKANGMNAVFDLANLGYVMAISSILGDPDQSLNNLVVVTSEGQNLVAKLDNGLAFNFWIETNIFDQVKGRDGKLQTVSFLQPILMTPAITAKSIRKYYGPSSNQLYRNILFSEQYAQGLEDAAAQYDNPKVVTSLRALAEKDFRTDKTYANSCLKKKFPGVSQAHINEYSKAVFLDLLERINPHSTEIEMIPQYIVDAQIRNAEAAKLLAIAVRIDIAIINRDIPRFSELIMQHPELLDQRIEWINDTQLYKKEILSQHISHILPVSDYITFNMAIARQQENIFLQQQAAAIEQEDAEEAQGCTTIIPSFARRFVQWTVTVGGGETMCRRLSFGSFTELIVNSKMENSR